MNSRNLILSIVLLLIGGAGGYLLSQPGTSGGSMAMQDSMSGDSGMMMHEEGRYDVPASQPAPTVSITPVLDPESGWNLHIVTTNFTFDPQNAGGDAIAGHGHMHVLVDGTMVGRAYSNWYYISALKPGKHTIAVELETNDHMDYYVNGAQVKASAEVTQPGAGTPDSAHAKVFELSVVGGKVVAGSGDIEVMQGDTVTLRVTNDADNEVHLHGYNIMTDLKAGQAGEVTFVASATGRFPFELEQTKQELGAVSVMPQ